MKAKMILCIIFALIGFAALVGGVWYSITEQFNPRLIIAGPVVLGEISWAIRKAISLKAEMELIKILKASGLEETNADESATERGVLK